MRRSLRRAGWALAAVGGLGIAGPAFGQGFFSGHKGGSSSGAPVATTPARPVEGMPAEVRILGPVGHSTTTVESSAPPVMSERVSTDDAVHVELALLAEPMLFSYNLTAVPQNGTIEVRGYVPNPAVREHALKVAGQHTSLRVVDRTQIHPTVATRTSVDSPDILQRSAKSLLEVSFGDTVKNVEVKADVRGRLVVTGRVLSLEDKLAVSRKLRRVGGCSCVDNRLTVELGGDVIPAKTLSAAKAPSAPVAVQPTAPAPEATLPPPRPVPPAVPSAPTPPMPLTPSLPPAPPPVMKEATPTRSGPVTLTPAPTTVKEPTPTTPPPSNLPPSSLPPATPIKSTPVMPVLPPAVTTPSAPSKPAPVPTTTTTTPAPKWRDWQSTVPSGEKKPATPTVKEAVPVTRPPLPTAPTPAPTSSSSVPSLPPLPPSAQPKPPTELPPPLPAVKPTSATTLPPAPTKSTTPPALPAAPAKTTTPPTLPPVSAAPMPAKSTASVKGWMADPKATKSEPYVTTGTITFVEETPSAKAPATPVRPAAATVTRTETTSPIRPVSATVKAEPIVPAAPAPAPAPVRPAAPTPLKAEPTLPPSPPATSREPVRPVSGTMSPVTEAPVKSTPVKPEAPKPASSAIVPAAATSPLPTPSQIKQRITAVCGSTARSVSVSSRGAKHLHISVTVQTEAEAQRLSEKILDLPELAAFEVDLHVELRP